MKRLLEALRDVVTCVIIIGACACGGVIFSELVVWVATK